MRHFLAAVAALGAVCVVITPAAHGERLGLVTGSGNFDDGNMVSHKPPLQAQFDVLQTIGSTSCRINVHPGAYVSPIHGSVALNWSNPTPEVLDDAMTYGAARGVTRPLMLFEYYVKWFEAGIGLGSQGQWEGLGAAFAGRFAPGGSWAAGRVRAAASAAQPSADDLASGCAAARGAGIVTYTAFNEPDHLGATTGFFPGVQPGPIGYLEALVGMSRGVRAAAAAARAAHAAGGVARWAGLSHNESSRLERRCRLARGSAASPGGVGALPAVSVNPGGFMMVRSVSNFSAAGLAPLLAPLYANGTLDGVDVHTEYDREYAPVSGPASLQTRISRRYLGFRSSMGAAAGTAVPSLMTTEFGAKIRLCSAEEAAKDELTAAVDLVTTTPEAGPGLPVTRLAFPWNVFHTVASDPVFGMALSDAPYVPAAKGTTWRVLLNATAPGEAEEWAWVTADPHGTGLSLAALPQPGAAADVAAAASECPGGAFAPLSGSACLGDRLSGAAASTMHTWQARPEWTSLPSLRNITLPGRELPSRATSVRVLGYDGERMTVPVPAGGGGVTVSGLRGNETYLLVAE